MEVNPSTASLTINADIKSDLGKAAKWARVMVVCGFILLLVLVAAGAYQLIYIDSVVEGDEPFQSRVEQGILSFAIFYFIVVLIAAIPIWYLMRFNAKMLAALRNENQAVLAESFNYLKRYFRFLGVIMLISLVLMLIILAGTVIGLRSL